MDFCIGGDLFFHCKKRKKFTENEARIYFVEILIALDYLHSKNIIYRDLKVFFFEIFINFIDIFNIILLSFIESLSILLTF